MNDLLSYIIYRAAREYGKDGLFNAIGFSNAFAKVSGVKAKLDGEVVRAMLWGRPDVTHETGGYYRYSP